MKLFNEEGHITGEGFEALVKENLDEMGRLEVSEHLDFCDQCVARYSELLTADIMLEAPAEIVPVVVGKIRQRNRNIFLNRFMKVSVAAGLAIVIWVGGFYRIGILKPLGEHPGKAASAARSVSDTLWNWSSGLDKLLSGFSSFLNTPPTEDTGDHDTKQ